MSFQKDFDELLNSILTDYKNQLPDADASQGSLVFIKSACLASALWGLYKYQDWISKQIFPDTADTEALEHHGWVRGLARTYRETDASYLARLLDYIRRPPAGGNQYDYVKWALEIDNVRDAYCFPLVQGLGTVDVVIVANETNTGSEVPSAYSTLTGTSTSVTASKLINSTATFQTSGVKIGDKAKNTDTGKDAAVVAVDSETQLTLGADIFTSAGQNYKLVSLTLQAKEYIDDTRPVTASVVRVLGPTIINQDVTMTVEGINLNKTQIKSDIEAHIKALIPGQTLYKSQLTGIAIQNGAKNAIITVPANDVTLTGTGYQMIRPGAVNIT